MQGPYSFIQSLNTSSAFTSDRFKIHKLIISNIKLDAIIVPIFIKNSSKCLSFIAKLLENCQTFLPMPPMESLLTEPLIMNTVATYMSGTTISKISEDMNAVIILTRSVLISRNSSSKVLLLELLEQRLQALLQRKR